MTLCGGTVWSQMVWERALLLVPRRLWWHNAPKMENYYISNLYSSFFFWNDAWQKMSFLRKQLYYHDSTSFGINFNPYLFCENITKRPSKTTLTHPLCHEALSNSETKEPRIFEVTQLKFTIRATWNCC